MEASSSGPEFTRCARCEQTDLNYLDAGARMFHTACGHALCARCREELFLRHRVNTCPARHCGATLTQSAADLSATTREQREFEAEKRARRRVAAVFNRSLGDFGGDARAHADFCERAEALVLALTPSSCPPHFFAGIYLLRW